VQVFKAKIKTNEYNNVTSLLCFYAKQAPSMPSNWRGLRKQGGPRSSKARKLHV